MSTLLRSCLSLLAGSVLATGLVAQTPSVPKIEFPAASPASTLKQRVGVTDIEINYSRPGVKGREIFGHLEPWGKVWRTGANSATKIKFSTPVKLNGTAIPAGTYELFSIPHPTEWTVIIHKDSSQWGSYAYNPANDIARVPARPVTLAESVESFTIDINDLRDDSATLNLRWAKTRVPVKIEVDVVSTIVPQIQAVMASDAAKKPYASAAMFYLDHGLDLKQAAAWMETAIQQNPNAFYLIYRKALILAQAGDKAAAIAAAEASIALAEKDTSPAKDEYLRLNRELLARLR